MNIFDFWLQPVIEEKQYTLGIITQQEDKFYINCNKCGKSDEIPESFVEVISNGYIYNCSEGCS